MVQYTSPPTPADYNALVWEIVRQIPSGRVSTYGQIAALIPLPRGMNLRDYEAWGARWVGGAMAACPEDVPWQRVINAQGKISIRRRGGHIRQRQLLEAEGVVFGESGRIDLAQFKWAGPLQVLGARGLSARAGIEGGS